MDTSFGSSNSGAAAAGNTSGLLSPSGPSRSSAGGGNNGSLELLLGPMYSGKTTELARRFRRAAAAGKKCILLKWAKDRRYCDSRHVVVTHDGQETAARPVEKLAEAHNTIWTYDFICIDEGQVRLPREEQLLMRRTYFLLKGGGRAPPRSSPPPPPPPLPLFFFLSLHNAPPPSPPHSFSFPSTY